MGTNLGRVELIFRKEIIAAFLARLRWSDFFFIVLPFFPGSRTDTDEFLKEGINIPQAG